MNYVITTGGELYHYGVKGMRWGHRKNPEIANARSAYKQAQKDYSKTYSNAYRKSLGAYSPIKKHRQAAKARWEDTRNKENAMNAARDNLKATKAKVKADKAAATAAENQRIRDARAKQGEIKKDIGKEAKNFALAVVGGDKKGRQASTRALSKLTDNYINNKKVAELSTSGEKKAAAVLAAVGAVALTANVVVNANRY